MWYSFFIKNLLSDLNQDLRISEGLKDNPSLPLPETEMGNRIPQSVHHPSILIQVIVNLASKQIHSSVLKVV